jgi:uncharacterized membrane protein YbhN (UPF0104 family)
MRKRFKNLAAITVLLGTATAFTHYFVNHPSIRHQLGEVSPITFGILFILYVCFSGSIALILLATVKLCNIHLPAKDGVLLTMWSSIINFFGPLQSGPAFRAVYLRKIHHISLKQYGAATLLYYGFFAVFSGLCVLSGVLDWRLLLGLVIVGISAVAWLLKSSLKVAQRFRSLPLQHAYKLGLATLLQVVLVTVIYYVELTSVDPEITLRQAVVYSGVANFALFVSLTPGAIGFREAFLVFSERLHHISSATIVTANVIDRSIYVALLGILFLVAISLHVKDRFSTKNSQQ